MAKWPPLLLNQRHSSNSFGIVFNAIFVQLLHIFFCVASYFHCSVCYSCYSVQCVCVGQIYSWFSSTLKFFKFTIIPIISGFQPVELNMAIWRCSSQLNCQSYIQSIFKIFSKICLFCYKNNSGRFFEHIFLHMNYLCA